MFPACRRSPGCGWLWRSLSVVVEKNGGDYVNLLCVMTSTDVAGYSSYFLAPQDSRETLKWEQEYLISFASMPISTTFRLLLLGLLSNVLLNGLICNWRVECWLTGCPETNRKLLKQWKLLFRKQNFQLRHCGHHLETTRGNTTLFVPLRKCHFFVFSLSSGLSAQMFWESQTNTF